MDPLNRGAAHAPANAATPSSSSAGVPLDIMLAETRRAFDSVADIYDGPRGNNALIQRMRELTWRTIEHYAPPASRLLDIGCGTGLDAIHFVTLGHSVCATDASGGMIAQTTSRALRHGSSDRIDCRQLGAQELDRLEGTFDVAYSNFGPLNCVPDLRHVGRECARLLLDDGHLIVTVMGRVCPWELGYYLLQRRGRRARVRFARDMTAVGLNQHTAWVRYYTPGDFYRLFAEHFELIRYQALSLWMPPPYLLAWHERHTRLGRMLGWLDDRTSGWPVLRDAGDHFLMILKRRR